MDSNVGLTIQLVGILLLILLSLFMRGSVQSASLRYWTAAWSSLALALFVSFAGFHLAENQRLLYSLYFLGEYLFGLCFLAGCRNHVSAKLVSQKQLYLLVPAFLMAMFLPYLFRDFNDLFMVHSVTMAALFALSFFTLRMSDRAGRTPGVRVMSAALFLLTIDFLHYVPVFGARKGLWGLTVPLAYLQYTSIFDLLLQILLGFGTIMVLIEGVRREVEQANHNLHSARDQLQLLAQIDPLTEALNRHAFHSLLRHPERGEETKTSGSVAVIDIDNLKPINDTLGHPAGDKAIRAVARAMRSLIRADDMLFRWGGDEFLVLMFKLPAQEAAKRMAKLNSVLGENCSVWTGLALSVTVSYGVAGFESLAHLGVAIEAADKAMYEQRHYIRSRNSGAKDHTGGQPLARAR